MSFRVEQKYRVNKNKLSHLYEWILKNNDKKMYLNRMISSIYFDNHKLSSYHQSIEGLVPRKKIRLRAYGDIKDKFKNSNLETKINSVEGRFKKSEKIKNPLKILENGIFDKEYGLCFPIIQVDYLREYFKVFNIRMTVDTKIKYKEYNKHLNKYYNMDDEIIIEAKAKIGNIEMFNYIDKKIHFEKIRFSKYCNSIEKVFYKLI